MKKIKVQKRSLLPIILISCLGIVVYSNSFYCSFHFDDVIFIINNFSIRDISNLQNIWNCWPCRFITFLSFAINYHSCQLNVFGYHLFNLGVHLISAILVWWLVLLTFSTPAMKGAFAGEAREKTVGLISLFSALIFVSHPVQTQAVTFIWQRAASMAAMFYLASICFYIKSRLMAGTKSTGIIYYICSLIAAILAMFTKEMAITLPFMIMLCETSFLNNKKGLNWKPLIPYFFIFLIIPVTWVFSSQEKIQATHSLVTNNHPVQYLLTQFRVILTYIRLVFLPLHQNLDYDYPLSKNIFEASTCFSFVFLAIVLLFAKRMFLKYRLVSFGIFWFFLTLLPESSFFPFADVIEEHRLYLPLAGYSIFLASGAYYLLGKRAVKTFVIVLTMIIVCNSVLTYQRNRVWKDDFTLWGDTIRKSPHKARPYNNLGDAYDKKGDHAQALVDYNKAIEINPKYEDAYFNRGILYDRQGNFSQALSDYNKVIEINPNHVGAYNNLGNIYGRQGDLSKALTNYNKAIEINPDYAEAYNNRGNVYGRQGNLSEALADYNKAIEIIPDDTEAYNNLGIIHAKMGDLAQAISDYNKAIQINPDYAEAYNNLGLANIKQGDFAQALSDYDKAIEINPDYAQAYYNLAVIYFQIEEYDKAWDNVRKASALGLEINPNFINALKQASGQ